MRIGIVGSRKYPDEQQVRRYVRCLPKGVTIVSGGAAGVDAWAADEARKSGKGVEEYRPDYAKYGRVAPLIRNGEIVARSQRVVAFWDGTSRGTADSIRRARALGIPVKVIRPEV